MDTGSVAFFRRSLTVRTTLCPFSLKEIVCDDAPEKEQRNKNGNFCLRKGTSLGRVKVVPCVCFRT